ncbi:MAG: hypothetical protein WBA41_23545 [Rivularia sp. (in: cyanobacteria)]
MRYSSPIRYAEIGDCRAISSSEEDKLLSLILALYNSACSKLTPARCILLISTLAKIALLKLTLYKSA